MNNRTAEVRKYHGMKRRNIQFFDKEIDCLLAMIQPYGKYFDDCEPAVQLAYSRIITKLERNATNGDSVQV